MYIFWLILIIVLTILEVSTINLISIWFITSALVSLFVSFFTDNFLIQFSIFVILGLLLLVTTRKYLYKVIMKRKSEKTNADRVEGMTGIVTEEITKELPGEVKVDGKHWTAITKSKKISKGKIIKVLNIEGVKLNVEEREEEK